MTVKSFIQICGTALIVVVVLQSTYISALQCYGCMMGTDVLPELNPKTECLLHTPPEELLVNSYDSIPIMQAVVDDLQNTVSSVTTMTPGPSCFKLSTETEGQRTVLRYIMSEAPAANFLDSSGCLTRMGIQMCFCRQDKCNSDGQSRKTASSSGTSFMSLVYFVWIFSFAMLAGQLF